MIRRVDIPEAGRAWVSRPRVAVFDDAPALLATCTASLAVAVGLTGAGALGLLAGVLAPALTLFAWYQASTRIARVHNAAVTALGAGDHEGARRTFREVLRPVLPRGFAAPALHNLGYLALLAGDFAAAEALLRAAGDALGSKPSSESEPLRGLVYPRHAMALARLGRLDEADAALARVTPEAVESRAHLALGRAYVDFQRGRHDAVVEQLERARPMTTRALSGEFALLAVALDALAVRQLSGIYRGSVRRAAVLPCSDATRATVERLLPGASDLLGRAADLSS